MSLLTGLLFEDKKDRARIDAEKQLREHFSKHGKVVDYTDKGFVIDGDVELSHKFTGSKLPVKFDTVSGSFFISEVPIASLEGAPSSAQRVDISATNIKSLKGMPHTTLGIFASGLELPDLIGIPGDTKNIFLDHTVLKSLKGAPAEVPGKMRVNAKALASLEHLPKVIGELGLAELPKDFPLMRLFLSKIEKVVLKGDKIAPPQGLPADKVEKLETIINKHLNKGRGGAVEAQKELMDSGLGEYGRV